jgi:tetratricopeptide (TPR) repeat protein
MGNRPEGTGLGTQPPLLLKLLEHQQRSEDNPDSAHALYRRFARADEGEGLSATETELYWMKKTAAFAWHEPWAYARLLGRKLLFLLVGPEGYDLVEVRRAAEKAEGWPLLPAPVLGMLGTLGLAVALLRRRAEPWTLLAFLSLAAVSLLFYVVSRYRLTTVPVWCVWAGFLVSSMGAALREARARVALGVATLGVALLFLGSAAVRRSERSLARTAEASVAGAEYGRQLAAGRLDLAMRTFVDIQAAAPFTRLMRDVRGIPFELPRLAMESGRRSAEHYGAETETDSFYLARLAMLAGQCETALPTFQQLGAAGFRLAIFDHLLDPNLLASECLRQEGRREEALEAALASVESYPGTAEGLAAVIAAAEALGGAEERRAEWEGELLALHDPLSAHYTLARARVGWGQYEKALASANRVLSLLPESGATHYVRARALLGLKQEEEALRAYGQALVLYPKHAFETQPFDEVMQAALVRQPEHPELLSLAAEHALRRGDVEQARELATQATLRFGEAPPPHHRERLGYLARAVPPGLKLTPAPLPRSTVEPLP